MVWPPPIGRGDADSTHPEFFEPNMFKALTSERLIDYLEWLHLEMIERPELKEGYESLYNRVNKILEERGIKVNIEIVEFQPKKGLN